MPSRAVFLDRDGTINTEMSFLSDPKALRLENKAVEGLKLAASAGFDLVVVSNQSGVARGLFDESAVERVNEALATILMERGVRIRKFYFCPHHPEGVIAGYARKCDCRKPMPGLTLKAAEELEIDLGHSYTIGDAARDLEAGRRAGTKTVLVTTGFGSKELDEVKSRGLADFVAADLAAAARWIIADSSSSGRAHVDR